MGGQNNEELYRGHPLYGGQYNEELYRGHPLYGGTA